MKKGNLLIVDDEPLLLEGIGRILKKSADNIFTAQNGLEALATVNAHEIHCVLCDINMPVMNGLELIKKIRSDDNQVPFIFYTAYGNHELMVEAVKYGAFDFLNKPHLDGLVDTITRGLKKGLGESDSSAESEDFMSEYKKLLSQIE